MQARLRNQLLRTISPLDCVPRAAAQRAYVRALVKMAHELRVITEAGKITVGNQVLSTYAL